MSYVYRPGVATTIHRVFVSRGSTTQPSLQPAALGVLSGAQSGSGQLATVPRPYPQGHQTKIQTAEVVPAEGLTVSVNQAIEIDTSQALTRLKVRSTGSALEAETAQAIVRLKVRSTGRASETDTSQGIVRLKVRSSGIATEADSARPITAVRVRAVGRANETDSAASVIRVLLAGRVTEVNTAQAITRNKVKVLGRALETDLGRSVRPPKIVVLGDAFDNTYADLYGGGAVLERNIARAFNPLLGGQFRPASKIIETDTASPITPRQVWPVLVGQAREQDLAGARRLYEDTFRDVYNEVFVLKTKASGQAQEVDSARPVTFGRGKTLGQAVEVDSAGTIVAQRTISIGNAEESDSARTVTLLPPTIVSVGRAVETDSAGGVVLLPTTTVSIGNAEEVDSARQISLLGTTVVSVGQAQEADSSTGVLIPGPVIVGKVIEINVAAVISPPPSEILPGREIAGVSGDLVLTGSSQGGDLVGGYESGTEL